MLLRVYLAAVLGAASAAAGTYYVAPNGDAMNDGSEERPWPTVAVALEKVGGGHEIRVKPGVYAGPIAIPKSASGTAEAPTFILSQKKWGAIVLGSTSHGIYTADGANWVVIDGFEVTGAMLDGIKMQGDNGMVRNCWVHGSGAMGISAHSRSGWTIERNLVEFNGQNPQFHHGIYADGDRYVIRDNIVRHNAGYGIQAYPAASNGYIMSNVVYGHARKPALVLQSPASGGRNVVANNTFADNAGGITVYKGNIEAILNNIITTSGTPISVDSASKSVWFAYDLCQPACGVQGDGVIAGDPLFVAPMQGAYYLQAKSPAIGAGKYAYSTAIDFWGNVRRTDVAPDLGALTFINYMTTSGARSDWYSGYGYRFAPNKGQEMPDLWTLPAQAVAELKGQ